MIVSGGFQISGNRSFYLAIRIDGCCILCYGWALGEPTESSCDVRDRALRAIDDCKKCVLDKQAHAMFGEFKWFPFWLEKETLKRLVDSIFVNGLDMEPEIEAESLAETFVLGHVTFTGCGVPLKKAKSEKI